MDKPKLSLVSKPLSAEVELHILQWTQDIGNADAPPLWDALSTDWVSLSELDSDTFDADPYDALAHDGIDAYSGADTVLDGSHDHALMMLGFALLGDDDGEA